MRFVSLVSLQCGICLCSISVFEDPVDMSCGHEFCRACWEGYGPVFVWIILRTSVRYHPSMSLQFSFPPPRFLNVKIQEGDAHNIFCPAYECYQLVPVHVIESVVSREMDQRYLQFDIKVKHTTCTPGGGTTQLKKCFSVPCLTPSTDQYEISSALYTRCGPCPCPIAFILNPLFLSYLPQLSSCHPFFSGICREQSCHPLVSCSALWAGSEAHPARPWGQRPTQLPPAVLPSRWLWQGSPLLLVHLTWFICCIHTCSHNVLSTYNTYNILMTVTDMSLSQCNMSFLSFHIGKPGGRAHCWKLSLLFVKVSFLYHSYYLFFFFASPTKYM